MTIAISKSRLGMPATLAAGTSSNSSASPAAIGSERPSPHPARECHRTAEGHPACVWLDETDASEAASSEAVIHNWSTTKGPQLPQPHDIEELALSAVSPAIWPPAPSSRAQVLVQSLVIALLIGIAGMGMLICFQAEAIGGL
jgi:hypothetical protein